MATQGNARTGSYSILASCCKNLEVIIATMPTQKVVYTLPENAIRFFFFSHPADIYA